ncbi:hypothetical protein [Lachnoclostridium sp. An181]|uniref:hypothetical protein n=1 Tax=Lachnoclostridium sp. An181 TaxID=1965575 RepID=UPI000B3A5E5E|nr:hypothetical protein [Lachnoclostridium sp. An181]OUP51349.1 hypothetical protein B5F18_01160 [Lachnoclostridium sp. An181]
MKQALYDIIYYIRRDISKYLLLILQYILFFTLIGNTVLYIDGLEKNDQMYCKKNGYVYIKLVQNSFNSSFIDIWDIPMSIEKMQLTLEKLNNDKRFIFSSLLHDQEIKAFVNEVNRYFGEDSYDDFLAHSYYPGYYKEYPSNKPSNEQYWNNEQTINMSMCKIDSDSIQHYGLSVSEGEIFSDNDYVFDIGSGEVSILLGAAYQEYFDIGDTIHLATPIKIMTATVKGFLKPNSRIENDTTYENMGEAPVILDYSIIMPCFKNIIGIENNEDKKFASLEYNNNLYGTLIFDSKVSKSIIKDSIKEINDYYLEQGIFTMTPLNGNNGFLYLQGEESVSIELLALLLFCLFIYNILAIHYSLNYFIKKQRHAIAIQILNGKKQKHVILSWCFIIAFIIMTSLILAYLYDGTWILQKISFNIIMLLISALLILLNIFFFIKGISKKTMHEMLWRH